MLHISAVNVTNSSSVTIFLPMARLKPLFIICTDRSTIPDCQGLPLEGFPDHVTDLLPNFSANSLTNSSELSLDRRVSPAARKSLALSEKHFQAVPYVLKWRLKAWMTVSVVISCNTWQDMCLVLMQQMTNRYALMISFLLLRTYRGPAKSIIMVEYAGTMSVRFGGSGAGGGLRYAFPSVSLH